MMRIQALIIAAFVAIKLAGTVLAAWSWWWLLMPEVPLLADALGRLGWL